jgi:hypothetical protein
MARSLLLYSAVAFLTGVFATLSIVYLPGKILNASLNSTGPTRTAQTPDDPTSCECASETMILYRDADGNQVGSAICFGDGQCRADLSPDETDYGLGCGCVLPEPPLPTSCECASETMIRYRDEDGNEVGSAICFGNGVCRADLPTDDTDYGLGCGCVLPGPQEPASADSR